MVGLKPLFAPDEVVSGGRVQITSLGTHELDHFDWLAAALAPESTAEELRVLVAGGDGVLIRDNGGESIGLALAMLGTPGAGDATVPFLAIDPARRFRGLGGEAGLVLEEHLRRRHSVERVYAPVPDGRGLAVYFWLRLGYRPLTLAESPGPLVGLSGKPVKGIWHVRDRS
jgi:GNAT superfamily N-acetyltransferase